MAAALITIRHHFPTLVFVLPIVKSSATAELAESTEMKSLYCQQETLSNNRFFMGPGGAATGLN